MMIFIFQAANAGLRLSVCTQYDFESPCLSHLCQFSASLSGEPRSLKIQVRENYLVISFKISHFPSLDDHRGNGFQMALIVLLHLRFSIF